MKIAFIQHDITFGQKEENIAKVEAMVEKNGASFDFLVLPELFASGYLFTSFDELESLAEPIGKGITSHRLFKLAQKYHAYIVAGLPERAEDKFYNSAILVGPNGIIGSYRKIHLFDTEKKWFTPGNRPFEVFDIGLANVGMMICFDWIFPESARSLALQGADIICHPANLVLPYCQHAMVTRSLENSVFSVTANRIGSEERGGSKLAFTGGSQILDPKGNILASASVDKQIICIVDIDPSQARDKWINPNNHLLNDRRIELYHLGAEIK